MFRKVCYRCKKEKDSGDFYQDAWKADGFHSYCKDCCRPTSNQHDNYLTYANKNIEAILLRGCKSRANRKGIPFSLARQDIIVPDNCPVCERKIILGTGTGRGPKPGSPSVDMYDPKLGYVVENIWVICWFCNRRKQDMSGEDHIAFGERLIQAFRNV